MSYDGEREIVERLAEEGLNATPDAVAALSTRLEGDGETPEAVVEAIPREARSKPVVTRADVDGDTTDRATEDGPTERRTDRPTTDDRPNERRTTDRATEPLQTDQATEDGATERRTERPTSGPLQTDEAGDRGARPGRSDGDTAHLEEANTGDPHGAGTSTVVTESRAAGRSRRRRAGHPPGPPEVVGDITGESTCTGELADFTRYFRDRYARLASMLEDRVSRRTVERVQDGRKTALVGMVKDVRRTRSDNRLVELEDPTGSINVVLSGDDVATAETLVPDEVIGVEGRASSDGGVVYVDDVYFPDVPRGREPGTADREVEAALVSDLHVGSDTFAARRWERFVDWLHEREEVEYLLIAGDLVEGVGIYPGQQDELTVVDLHDQYEECAERLRDLPDDLRIVTITGNHDTVRLAEPQPALPEEFKRAFDSNVEFAGNPSTVTLEGVDVLMYHGVSLNPFAEMQPDVEVERPETAMVHMLRKRHLAPMFGRVRLAPEERDHLVIEDVPDVLHTGHTHTVGADRYNGVNLVNTGAWQTQTDYQRKVNIQPDVGYAAVVDLSTLGMQLKQFE